MADGSSISPGLVPASMDHHHPHHPTTQLALELQALEGRSRSSTWPCQPDEDDMILGGGGGGGVGGPNGGGLVGGCRDHSESPIPNVPPLVPKTDSNKKMRNAWGNLSYADLITQAILSSPEKRLTLSEIYEWIVQNVPYFSDKASSPSTAGWKVREEREIGKTHSKYSGTVL